MPLSPPPALTSALRHRICERIRSKPWRLEYATMKMQYSPPGEAVPGDQPPLTIGHASVGELHDDVLSRLLDRRVVFLGASLDEATATLAAAQLLHLQAASPGEAIHLCINTSGGSPTALLMLFDTMESLATEVSTVCVGQASGASALLLAAGTKGKRLAFPHARVILAHMREELGGVIGDLDVHAREVIRQRRLLEELLAAHTKSSVDRVSADMQRTRILTANEAREYGIVDRIVADTAGLPRPLVQGKGLDPQMSAAEIREALSLLPYA
ncbi:hypothetical protein BH18ACT15_BH18ACT15_12910 [soil metagenome]